MKSASTNDIAFKVIVELNGLKYIYDSILTAAIKKVIEVNSYIVDEEQFQKVKRTVFDALTKILKGNDYE